jgi:hypothetical protein
MWKCGFFFSSVRAQAENHKQTTKPVVAGVEEDLKLKSSLAFNT